MELIREEEISIYKFKDKGTYYWPQMEWHTKKIAWECKECQIHDDVQKVPATELTSITTSVPSARWDLDIAGRFPTASNGRKFIFIEVDYFIKWVEAEAVKSISQENVVKFVFRNIICRFRVPLQIITVKWTQFVGSGIRKFCKDNEIKLSFASVYDPQTNGN